MAFHLLLIFALLNPAFKGSHATLTEEELHWKSVFPNTPMPKVLQDILPRPGEAIIFRGGIAPESKGVNDPEFGAYWYGDNSGKESKGENIPTNKGTVNDPDDHFRAYWYGDDSSEESKVESNEPANKGVNDPEFGAYAYDSEYKGTSVEESRLGDNFPNNKGVNDPEFGAYAYDSEYKGTSVEESRSGDNSPNNKGVNDPEFGAYAYDFEYKGSVERSRSGDNSPNNKGVNDPEFGAYAYDSEYKGTSVEESRSGDNSPKNKGVNDPEFGAYAYDSKYKGSVERSRSGDNSPNNKGVNDPEFGAYAYDYEYKSTSVEESRSGDNSPNNKGVNDPEFGAYAYDSEYNGSVEGSRSGDDSANNKDVVNDPELGNKYSLGRKSSLDKATAIKETIYFFQKDLLPGTKVNLPRLIQKSDRGMFLPHQMADSMPLSSDKLPEILKNFSLKADSRDANYVKITVKNCERAEMRGEEKYCATSLESFVDSSVSMLGKNIQLLSHELKKETKNPLFTIGRVRNMGENDLVCHKMKYPYAVYLCHSIKKTTVYKVPLVSRDGTKANAVAVCHKDTSAWSPNHIAFRFLKVKPGTVPICHFLGRNTLVWVPKY